MENKHLVVIVGAGPAGLFCADQLLAKGFRVDLYDHSSGIGKKFLVAGNGGLNLTHSEDLSRFASRYGKDEELFIRLLQKFSPTDLRAWCSGLGVGTFVGTSGRVFPQGLRAAEILSKWKARLTSFETFNLYLNHRLTWVDRDKTLTFSTPHSEIQVRAEHTILALGGASWSNTNSA